MDTSDSDLQIINEFQANDEWDECFNAVESYEAVQELIATSNAVDEEQPRLEYLEVLHRCFGHRRFRPMQWKIISSVINDRRDNCAIMATGYGKSLCFQYPSVYVGGITIVISPLISLMEDQVLSLTMSNISACLLGSAQTNQKQVLDEIFENKYSLVYVTPEFCCGDYGQDLLQRMNQNLAIILLAIDEAHCVSSWGHDFRYQYRELGKLRSILPSVPILAVTATATPKVRSDIISCLKLRNPQVLCSGFDRPNLQFSVHLKGSEGVFPDLRKIMTDKNKSWGFPGSTIIYCITRKQTEEVTELLKRKGVRCLAYHAGMSIKARKEAHELFVKDKIKVIVATIAFGMGIDKPDVRNIIHYGASKDIESYYQEVGRAGRDGQPSICVTFYRAGDFDLHQAIREMSGTNATNRARQDAMEKIMRKYLETRDCRRQFILNHFEGSATPKKPRPNCCDNCTRKLYQTESDSNKYEGLNDEGLYDFTKDAFTFLNAVQTMSGRFGVNMYVLFLRGSHSCRLFKNYLQHPLHGSGKHQSEDWWKTIARILEREGYLQKSAVKKGRSVFNSSTYSVSEKGQTFIKTVSKNSNVTKILLQPTPEMFKLLKLKHKPEPPEGKTMKVKPLPSTSTKPSGSKPSLKLLQAPGSSDSRIELKNDGDDLSTTSESDMEKEERMKVYRLLMNKRADIASKVDCMPYMVASNEALMKMAQTKPCTVKALRECQLDGFTEVKLKRFGEEFVQTIRVICQLKPVALEETSKKSIQDILAEHPLPGTNLGATAEASYSMYKSGLTVQEIATKRGVVPATVLAHLIDAIKAGYPIKMIDLNVTDEIRDTIINVIRNLPSNSNTLSAIPIKNACPPDFTWDVIKVVMAFLQVRDHLANLKIPYEEFESSLESQSSQISLNSTTQSGKNLDHLNNATQSGKNLDHLNNATQSGRNLDHLNNATQSGRNLDHLNNATQSGRNLDYLLDIANQDSSPQMKTQSRKVNLSSLSCGKKCEKRDADSESEESFVFQYSSKSNPTKKQKLQSSDFTAANNTSDDCLGFLDSPPRTHATNSQTNQSSDDDLAILDSPPRIRKFPSQKPSQETDLEKSLLEDDFFDDATLDDFEKVIDEAKNNASVSSTINVNMDQNTKKNEDGFVKECESPLLTKLDSNNVGGTNPVKNKLKKFQFKSKVPASVEQSTQKLYSQRSQ